MIRKSLLTFFSFILITFTLAGCVTSELWEDHSIYKPYEEAINAFLINPKDDSVIFLGEKYHYIFEKNDQLSFLLEYYGNPAVKFSIKDGNYYVDSNKIKASFSVIIDDNTTDKNLLEWYEKNKNNRNIISLKGMRYLANKKVNENSKKLSEVIHIKVYNQYVVHENVAVNILMTPLAVITDGVIAVAVAGSWIILSPVIAYDSLTK